MIVITLDWLGPFAWPGTNPAGPLLQIADCSAGLRGGVYLWTVEHSGGFLIYAAGITRRSFAKRFREHTQAYHAGVYTVFDAAHLRAGRRVVVWPGYWFRKRTPEMLQDYRVRASTIHDAVVALLASYRVFLAPLAPVPRVLERVEAAVMQQLYSGGDPVSEIPDRGMALAPRWPSEPPLVVVSRSASVLLGLPERFPA